VKLLRALFIVVATRLLGDAKSVGHLAIFFGYVANLEKESLANSSI